MEEKKDFYLSEHYYQLKDYEKSIKYYIGGIMAVLKHGKNVDRQFFLRLETLFAKRISKLQDSLKKMQKIPSVDFSQSEGELLKKHENIMYAEIDAEFEQVIKTFELIRDHINREKHELIAYLMKVQADFIRRKASFKSRPNNVSLAREALNLYISALSILEKSPCFCPYKLDVFFNYAKHMVVCYNDSSKVKELVRLFESARTFFMKDFGENSRYYAYIMKFISFYLGKRRNIQTITFDTWVGKNDNSENSNIVDYEDFFILYIDA